MKIATKLLLLTLSIFFAFSCDPCNKQVCLNDGVCEEGTCDCPTEWGGEDCSIPACQVMTCQHGGTCADGVCDCPSGYYGVFCEREINQLFTGSFTATENCPTHQGTYNVSITAGPTPFSLRISNLHQDGQTLDAVVDNEQSFYIPNQSYNYPCGNATMNGNGYRAATYTITYRRYCPTMENCSVTLN